MRQEEDSSHEELQEQKLVTLENDPKVSSADVEYSLPLAASDDNPQRPQDDLDEDEDVPPGKKILMGKRGRRGGQ